VRRDELSDYVEVDEGKSAEKSEEKKAQ